MNQSENIQDLCLRGFTRKLDEESGRRGNEESLLGFWPEHLVLW